MLHKFRRLTARGPQEPTPQNSNDRRPLQLVVGLGNPGSSYAKHRHNVGFWTVNRLAKRLGIDFTRRSGLVELGEGEVDGHLVVLAKPRTMMNLSGKAVLQALKVYGLKPEQMVVIYDELDLPAGRVRLRPRGSHGGHNGMRSIVASTGSQDFPRIRIGIGRPRVDGEPTWDPEHVADWVLGPPGPTDRATLEAAADRAAEAVEIMLHEGVGVAMQRVNAEPRQAQTAGSGQLPRE
jgi:PTH1 family peptidyl-tRNA hydrolase